MKSDAVNVSEYLAELPPDRQSCAEEGAQRDPECGAGSDGINAARHGCIRAERHALRARFAEEPHGAVRLRAEVVDAHREALGKLDCGKGCIRFRKLEELPLDAISDILTEAARKAAQPPEAMSTNALSRRRGVLFAGRGARRIRRARAEGHARGERHP